MMAQLRGCRQAHANSYVELLCWKGSDAHSGGVGFWHAVHLSDVGRRDAKTRAHAAHRAVRWCHERIRS